MTIHQLEYKGLNLMDVVGTVELAIDTKVKTIHIFDTQQIVEPDYDYVSKGYRLSDGFYKMADVLKKKPFFSTEIGITTVQWINMYRWVFYCSKQMIKQYENGCIRVYTKDQFSLLEKDETYYLNYISRLK